MTLDVHATADAPGVPPERALAWWSDFRDGDVSHGRGLRTRRRILARTPAGVEMEDRVRGLPFRERLVARVDGMTVAFEGENTVSRFRGRYEFAPVADGTRVTLVARVDLKAALRPTELLARPVGRRVLASDLRWHVAEMRRELSASAPSG